MNLYHESRQAVPLMTVNGRDEKAWAKRLIWRLENGDTELMPIQIQFAKEALGIPCNQN